ncbi:MAG: RDD family protein [Nevskiaceae bacterium]
MSAIVLPAPLWRRLASALYDALLLAAVWMVVAMADLFLRGAAGLPYNVHVFRAELVGAGALLFGFAWTHGGQTLGMRAWRLQLRSVDGRPLNWPVALARYAFAWIAWLPLGAGVLWSALDPARRAWHDRLSGTELVLLPKT